MNCKVSVIMSTLNTKKEYLEKSITSILNQKYSNFEFIIICDGGNDIEYIKQYTDSRIKTIIHSNTKGLAYSLNEAIHKSKGEYIARMDSDDYSLPNRLKIQVDYMDRHPNIDICGTYYKYFGDSKKIELNVFNSPSEIKCQLFSKNVLAHPSVMIRKSFLVKNNLEYSIKYKYSQDFELWTRAMNYGNFYIIPKLCFLYRIHNQQISIQKKKTQTELYEKILTRNLKLLEIDESSVKYLKMINSMNSFDEKELLQFIDLTINNNDRLGVFDKKTFKNIMYNFYFILIIKNKKIISSTFSKSFFRIWNLYNIRFCIKKSVGYIFYSIQSIYKGGTK